MRFDFTNASIQMETGVSYLNSSYDNTSTEDITYGFIFGYTF